MVPQLTIGVDREPHSRFGEERDIHHAVPDGDDLVLLYFPLRRKPPHNRSLALWTDPDRDAAGENPVLIVEFVAEGCVRFEQLKGRFRHLPRAAGDQYDFARAGVQPVDELFRAGHRPELPSRPQDLGLGDPRSRSARARNPISQSIRPSIPARVIAATSASFPTIVASSGRDSLKIRVFSRSKTTSFTGAAIFRSRCGYLCSSAPATAIRQDSEDFHVSVDFESLLRDAVRLYGTRVLEPP